MIDIVDAGRRNAFHFPFRRARDDRTGNSPAELAQRLDSLRRETGFNAKDNDRLNGAHRVCKSTRLPPLAGFVLARGPFDGCCCLEQGFLIERFSDELKGKW